MRYRENMDLGRKVGFDPGLWRVILFQSYGHQVQSHGLDQAAHKVRVAVHTGADQIQTRCHSASLLYVLQEEII